MNAPLVSVSPHLADVSYLALEEEVALSVTKDLFVELIRLSRRVSTGTTHTSRVALRRWWSITPLLDHDGWLTAKFKRGVDKPLRRLNKRLGELRDWDINLDLGRSAGLPKETLKDWEKRRDQSFLKVKKVLKEESLKKVARRLWRFVRKRPRKLAAVAGAPTSAWVHLEPFLAECEKKTRRAEKGASTPEELHALRLEIKAWRYTLTEFFGLTNLALVRAQQHLGKLNDIRRVIELAESEQIEGLDKLYSEYDANLSAFQKLRGRLPYGLRPQLVSLPNES